MIKHRVGNLTQIVPGGKVTYSTFLVPDIPSQFYGLFECIYVSYLRQTFMVYTTKFRERGLSHVMLIRGPSYLPKLGVRMSEYMRGVCVHKSNCTISNLPKLGGRGGAHTRVRR